MRTPNSYNRNAATMGQHNPRDFKKAWQQVNKQVNIHVCKTSLITLLRCVNVVNFVLSIKALGCFLINHLCLLALVFIIKIILAKTRMR